MAKTEGQDKRSLFLTSSLDKIFEDFPPSFREMLLQLFDILKDYTHKSTGTYENQLDIITKYNGPEENQLFHEHMNSALSQLYNRIAIIIAKEKRMKMKGQYQPQHIFFDEDTNRPSKKAEKAFYADIDELTRLEQEQSEFKDVQQARAIKYTKDLYQALGVFNERLLALASDSYNELQQRHAALTEIQQGIAAVQVDNPMQGYRLSEKQPADTVFSPGQFALYEAITEQMEATLSTDHMVNNQAGIKTKRELEDSAFKIYSQAAAVAETICLDVLENVIKQVYRYQNTSKRKYHKIRAASRAHREGWASQAVTRKFKKIEDELDNRKNNGENVDELRLELDIAKVLLQRASLLTLERQNPYQLTLQLLTTLYELQGELSKNEEEKQEHRQQLSRMQDLVSQMTTSLDDAQKQEKIRYDAEDPDATRLMIDTILLDYVKKPTLLERLNPFRALPGQKKVEMANGIFAKVKAITAAKSGWEALLDTQKELKVQRDAVKAYDMSGFWRRYFFKKPARLYDKLDAAIKEIENILENSQQAKDAIQARYNASFARAAEKAQQDLATFKSEQIIYSDPKFRLPMSSEAPDCMDAAAVRDVLVNAYATQVLKAEGFTRANERFQERQGALLKEGHRNLNDRYVREYLTENNFQKLGKIVENAIGDITSSVKDENNRPRAMSC